MILPPKELLATFESLEKSSSLQEVLSINTVLDNYFYGGLPEVEFQHHDPNAYSGLDSNALLTPYLDYFKILRSLDIKETITDLGSGYSRGSFLSKYLNLSTCFGIEFVEERVKFSQENYNRLYPEASQRIFQKDLRFDSIEETDAYFLYFPKGKVLNKIISDLLNLNTYKRLYAIESHGDVIPFLESLSFIKKISRMPSSIPRHDPYIYQFKLSRNLLEVSFKNNPEEWIILNSGKGLYFEVELYQSILKSFVIWFIPVSECFIEVFNNREHINFNGRLIDYTKTEKLIRVSKERALQEYEAFYQEANINKIFSLKKQYFCEKSNGSILKLQ